MHKWADAMGRLALFSLKPFQIKSLFVHEEITQKINSSSLDAIKQMILSIFKDLSIEIDEHVVSNYLQSIPH